MSLTGIQSTNNNASARKKYKKALLRYHPNKGGTSAQVRQVYNEWEAWQRAQSRPSPRPAQRASGSSRQRARVIKPEFMVMNPASRYSHSANKLRFTMDTTVGSVLQRMRAYAILRCPEMFRGFSILLVCINDKRIGNKVARKVTITGMTNKNAKLASLIPNSHQCTDVYMNVIVPATPRGNKSKFIFF